MQLHKIDGGSDYAEFLHAPRKKFTDFGMKTKSIWLRIAILAQIVAESFLNSVILFMLYVCSFCP